MTAASTSLPVLENGDRMSREEFHRRYLLRPDLRRVELIEGVVYMPMAISFEGHSDPQKVTIAWLAAYEARHPGVKAGSPATVLLDELNEPEPDAILFRTDRGLQGADDLIHGAPDLVVEIATSGVSRDLHQKLQAYERNGVQEYIVWRVRDQAIDWFELRYGAYVRREPGPDGIIESNQFPGLRLDVPAALRRDIGAVLGAVR